MRDKEKLYIRKEVKEMVTTMGFVGIYAALSAIIVGGLYYLKKDEK